MERALAGDLPDGDHVILCAFPPDTREYVAKRVKLANRLVIMLRHPGEFDPMAKAWLDAGCRAVIRPGEDIDQNAALMFVLAFYYHLLAHDLPDHGQPLTEREAFEAARGFDTGREGTGAFRMVEGGVQSLRE